MASSALDALGLAYGDSDDSDDDDDDEEEEAKDESLEKASTGAPALPAVQLPPLAAAALPDAGDLLSELPDEVDWDARQEEDVPTYDPKGTTYNTVALPASMAKESEQHNAKRKSVQPCRKQAPSAASSKGVDFSQTSMPVQAAQSSVQPAKVARTEVRGKSSGVLLPPQLRRPNVTTEELSAMRSAKRQKPAGS